MLYWCRCWYRWTTLTQIHHSIFNRRTICKVRWQKLSVGVYVNVATNLRQYLCLSLFTSVCRVEFITESLLYATFHGIPQSSITIVYGPAKCTSSLVKYYFLDRDDDHLHRQKRYTIQKNLFLGDFKARIGVDIKLNQKDVSIRYGQNVRSL